jgi:hypothetical protein
MSRYGELMFLEDDSGRSAMNAALEDVSAGALAYDTTPLSSVGRLAPFSPQFQSMTLEKGAMVFHMLRGEVGNKAFLEILKGTLSQYTDSSIRTQDLVKVAESQSQQQLTSFFAQWIDGTGAPRFTDKYAVYRLGNNKGFRTIGEIQQDLDLFRTAAAHQHRSRRLGSEDDPRFAGADRNSDGTAVGSGRRPGGRLDRVQKGTRCKPAEFPGQLQDWRSAV